MKWTTVEYVKKHSRLCGNEEDDILETYIDSAEQTLLNVMDRSYDELLTMYNDVPKPIVHATLLLVDHFYTHRGPDSPYQLSAVPDNIGLLVKPYVKLSSSNNCQ